MTVERQHSAGIFGPYLDVDISPISVCSFLPSQVILQASGQATGEHLRLRDTCVTIVGPVCHQAQLS